MQTLNHHDNSPPFRRALAAVAYHPLPQSVESLLETIRQEQALELSADAEARSQLARIGVQNALQILRTISRCTIRENLSSYIVYMARQFPTVQTRAPPQPAPYQESVNFSGPASPTLSVYRDDTSADLTGVMPKSLPTRIPSRTVLEALGQLEFRKAFLVISYCGSNKLEDMVSLEFVQNIKTKPMISFEQELWKGFGCRCVSESDRRNNIDWDSGKTHIYQCHVDPEGKLTFKGPYLHDKRSHLYRVLGDDNVLLVKFADQRSLAYQMIAKEGITLGLRHYHFFVFKDGGKEEKKNVDNGNNIHNKSQASLTVKCYFVRIESKWAMDFKDPVEPYILCNKSIHDARGVFMHIHTVSSVEKYIARFSLILSNTIPSKIDLSTVNVQQIADIPCLEEDGTPALSKDGEPMIHTDGTGYISEDLAMQCPKDVHKGKCPKDLQKMLDGLDNLERAFRLRDFFPSSEDPPLLIQFRLFYNGSAMKGTLLINKELPPRTIQVRPSMIKVNADSNMLFNRYCNSLEIVGTSKEPKRTSLSKSLIALLHFGGVPKEYFLDLLTDALCKVQDICRNKRHSIRVAHLHGGMDDYIAARMIFGGIPLDEPFLQYRLSVLMKEEWKGLKAGKIPITDCCYLMGTVDPTGMLEPNEVCVVLGNGQVSGKVLVYKHPGLHFGDIHVLTARYIEGLEKVVGNSKYAIFFPVKGRRSLGDEIANSDYDGDMYWVSTNPQLLDHFKASEPWDQRYNARKTLLRKPTDFSCTELESELFGRFLVNRFDPSYAMSAASDSWMAYMDRLLTEYVDAKEKEKLHRMILQLIDIYYEALDAPKTGKKVEVPPDIKADKFPHYLERAKSYHSTSVLGVIFDKVVSAESEDMPLDEIRMLPCFSEPAPDSCLRMWEERYNTYRIEMSRALNRDTKESKDAAANEVYQKYKWLLYEAEEFDRSKRKEEDIFNEALAIYQINYKYVNSLERKQASKCGFVWKVAGVALCKLHVIKLGVDFFICSRSVLAEIL